MKRLWLVGLLAILVTTACAPPFQTKNESDMLLRVIRISGISGHDDEEGTPLLSDVIPVFNDIAEVEVMLIQKNPNVTVIGDFNDVELTSYTVRYVRADGRGIEGVDVPFAISGGLSGTVFAGGSGTAVSFTVVRHQAKLEPPLQNLRDSTGIGQGGAGLLSLNAEITIYGRTTSGKTVSGRGILEITFADYAND